MSKPALSAPDRIFIAQLARAIITNVLQVGGFVMAYFAAVESVTYYHPQSAWIRNLPLIIAIGGCISFIVRGWEISRVMKHIDRDERRRADAEADAALEKLDRIEWEDDT